MEPPENGATEEVPDDDQDWLRANDWQGCFCLDGPIAFVLLLFNREREAQTKNQMGEFALFHP